MVMSRILLITPPFTQLNTPYPATAYLKGFLNTLDIESRQADLSLEVILHLFSSSGLSDLFEEISTLQISLEDEMLKRIISLKEEYIATIDLAIAFLQGREPSLAHLICNGDFLPVAGVRPEEEDLEWAFGTMGIQDKARHIVTLYLEDISHLVAAVDAHFGFSRYAEQLGRSASSFDDLYNELLKPYTYIDRILIQRLKYWLSSYTFDWVALSVPFPGNLYSALRCGEYIKKNYPQIKVEIGGGFITTELRQLSDARLFLYCDYITLDDGELPLKQLLIGRESDYVRTYILKGKDVVYVNNNSFSDIPMSKRGIPDYSGLLLDKYLSVIEMTNPMHSLWSNGRWNKLTLAHGCYWGKCAFCDGSLDYIGRFEPLTAQEIANRMEALISQTGERGFHFVDEAAPPALLKELALEIIRRKLVVVWWTNIRFEKSYTLDLCRLLKRSGCIAVSGGLEVASDRLLKLINKGVTVPQVAKVTDYFTQSGIMVHAYLMYGFPSETAQETIDSLEIVRQLFMNGLVQSGFWHRFAMTAHSPVGCHPEKKKKKITEKPFGGFARNDIDFVDTAGADHDLFGEGLRISLYNYMRGVGFELPLYKWFDTPVPQTTIPPTYIERLLDKSLDTIAKDGQRRLVWISKTLPWMRYYERTKKGKKVIVSEFIIMTSSESQVFRLKSEWGQWLLEHLRAVRFPHEEKLTLIDWEKDFRIQHGRSFDELLRSSLWKSLRENGLYFL